MQAAAWQVLSGRRRLRAHTSAVETVDREPREILAIRGIGKTSNLFRWELTEMARRLGTNASYHAAVMAIESGFDPAARNPTSNASGLVQFMPFWLRAQKPPLSPEGVRAMSDVDQLALVERFYRPHAAKMQTPCDYYLATFLPIMVGADEGTVIGEKDSTERIAAGAPTKGAIYKQNIGFDPKPKDGERKGFFTVADVCGVIRGIVKNAEGQPPIVVTFEQRPSRRAGSGGAGVGGAVLLAGVVGTAIAVSRARK